MVIRARQIPLRPAWAMLALGLASCAPRADVSALVSAAEAKGVTDRRVLEALASVPREQFVPASERDHAFEDRSLPIEGGQRITQPSLVGLMTQLLELGPSDKVLEVGTGSGYQAAVLARLSQNVFSVELLPELASISRERLARLGYAVHVRTGDGYQGWPEEAPFDAIIVTAAPESVPAPLVEQLREGGRVVIPLGSEEGPQTLTLLRKQSGRLVSTSVEPVRFVPLVREPRPVVGPKERMTDQLFAFLFSLAVEIPIALLCCARSRRTALATLGAALFATGVTHPFAWWAITAWSGPLTWAVATAIVEAALTVLETFSYRLLVGVTWRRAALTSLLANVASFGLGQLVWWVR